MFLNMLFDIHDSLDSLKYTLLKWFDYPQLVQSKSRQQRPIQCSQESWLHFLFSIVEREPSNALIIMCLDLYPGSFPGHVSIPYMTGTFV